MPKAVEAFQPTGFSKVADPDVLPRRRPSIGFLSPFDLTFDVEAPDRLPRLEPERLERDFDFGDPALLGDTRGGVPDTVPVRTEGFAVVRDLTVGASARRIHLKEEAVSVIEKWIEDDRDPIIHLEVRIARELCGDNLSRGPIVADDSNVERVVVVQDADDRVFGRLVVLHGLPLTQHADRRSPLPCGFVETAVKSDRLSRPKSDRDRRVALRPARLLGGGSDDQAARHD